MSKHIAIDLGAESGRVMLGTYVNGTLNLEEIYRFLNTPIKIKDALHWSTDLLWNEIKTGLGKIFSEHSDIQSIGADTWGVDFVLFDKDGNMLDFPYHYRDSRTDGLPEKVFEFLPAEELYLETGIQIMQLNTLFQLVALKEQSPEIFNKIDKLPFMPDWINYQLTGKMHNEFTIASTSQMMNMATGEWSEKILDIFDIPKSIFPSMVQPGTEIGMLKESLVNEFNCKTVPVYAVGSHDTASAVAAVPAENDKTWAYLSSGTWSLIGIESNKPFINKLTAKEQFTNEGGVNNSIRFLKNIVGLWILQETKRLWEWEGDSMNYSQLVEIAEKSKPFSALIDPEYQAFFTGGNMPEKINEFLKKTSQKTIQNKGEIVRTIIEGLALKYQSIIEKPELIYGQKIDVLHIVGGGSQNKLLNQMTANAIGKKVVAGPVEATVCGSIITQLLGLDLIGDINEGRQIIKKSFECDEYLPENIDKWKEMGNKIRGLSSKL